MNEFILFIISHNIYNRKLYAKYSCFVFLEKSMNIDKIYDILMTMQGGMSMKKIIWLMAMILVLSGCSSKQVQSTFMLEKSNHLYTLYNQNGKKLSEEEFVSYQEVDNIGYIVSNSKKQYGFISSEGKEIISMGEYGSLESCQQMLYARKNINEKPQSIVFEEKNLSILDSKGQVLYQASKDILIKADQLPIIKQGQDFLVLYEDGKELYKGKDEVLYARIVSNGKYICLGFKDHITFYYVDNENGFHIDIKTNKQYEISASCSHGVLLNDKQRTNAYYIDIENKKFYEIKLPIQKAYFDDADNLLLESSGKTYIYSVGNAPVELNSYYYSSDTYVKRSQDVYGPHQIYKSSSLVGELENCQCYPNVERVHSQIFPVYIRDTGYQFYNFDGKKVIDKTYQEANPFDSSGRAIVKIDNKGYSLIDETGNVLTKDAYYSIKYIGSSYYAVYNEVGMFGVIDLEGKEVFSMEYTYLPEQAYVKYHQEEFLLLNKNGRSYIYDIQNDLKEVCSGEGEVTFNSKGYFKIGNTYYTIEGKQIK